MAHLLIIGDRKGPTAYDVDGSELLTIDTQRRLPFQLAGLLPEDHYARKNLGYLVAQHRGSPWIYETDDDAPLSRWAPRAVQTVARPISARGWVNVYRLFSDELIWPRGFPLALIRDAVTQLPVWRRRNARLRRRSSRVFPTGPPTWMRSGD